MYFYVVYGVPKEDMEVQEETVQHSKRRRSNEIPKTWSAKETNTTIDLLVLKIMKKKNFQNKWSVNHKNN